MRPQQGTKIRARPPTPTHREHVFTNATVPSDRTPDRELPNLCSQYERNGVGYFWALLPLIITPSRRMLGSLHPVKSCAAY